VTNPTEPIRPPSEGVPAEGVPAGILLYGMYEATDARSAPMVRISMMTAALGRHVPTETITGGRLARAKTALRWLLSGGPRRVRAVYVESATTAATPMDLAFLATMRLLRRPVGVYFRDAYQLFRAVHPRVRRRQVLTDLLWRVSLPLLRGIASVPYAPTAGLADVLGLRRAVLLPPGADPTAPSLGVGVDDLVGAIVQMTPGSGFDTLLAAMALVRNDRPGARLRIITRPGGDTEALPDWVETVIAGRSGLAEGLADVRACVLPLPVNSYTNLAVAVRLLDLLALGKPVVATDTIESRSILEASGGGLIREDTAEGLADGILAMLSDRSLAARCSASARSWAEDPANTWDDRARTVCLTLGVPWKDAR
jgi:glycosyltransferase involved in cell wall biosynthesis